MHALPAGESLAGHFQGAGAEAGADAGLSGPPAGHDLQGIWEEEDHETQPTMTDSATQGAGVAINSVYSTPR